MANPIKTSDILQDDNLDALIAKIKQLESVVESLTAALKKQELEASELEATTKTLNGTTAQGREQIAKNAKAADDVEKAYKTYQKAISDTNTQIQYYRTEANIANQIKKAEAKLAANVADSYNALSAQYSLIKIRLNAMSKAEREATDEGKALVKRSKEIHDEMKRLQAETGNTSLNVGNYTESIKQALDETGLFSGQLAILTKVQSVYNSVQKAGAFVAGTFSTATSGASKMLKIFKLALISTGIGAIVVALGSLAAMFSKNQKVIDTVNQVLAGLGAVIDVIIDRAAVLGGAIVKLFSGDFVGAAKDAKAAVAGVNDEMSREYQLAKQIEAQMQSMHKQQILLNIEREASRAKIKELNLLAEDTTKSEKERAAAARNAIGIERDLLNRQLENQKIRIAAQLGQSKFTKETEEQLKRIASGAASADEVISNLGLSTSTVADLEEFEGVVTEFFRTQQESVELQTTLNNKLNTIEQQAAQKRKAAFEQRKRQEEEEKQRIEETQKARISQIEDEKAFALAKIDAETEYYNTSEAYQRERAIERFNIEQEANRAILEEQKRFGMISLVQYETALLEMSAKQREFAAKIKANREKESPMALPGFDFGKKTEEMALKRVREISDAAAKAVRDKLKEQERPENIYDLLGINITDEGKDQVKSSLDFAKQQLTDFMNFRTQIANRNVQNADREVAAAENALNREIELQAAGLANNVATRQKDLSDAQARQREALKEQEQAQRAQQRIQTIEQSVNLITALAKVFKEVPFPLNIAASAVMLGAFASAKIQAANLARRQFGEGDYTILEGGSHASGNDIFIGQGKDGRPEFAEGGEARMILSKRSTKKYRSLLPEIFHALKAGTFESEFTRQANAARELPLIVNTGGGQLVNMKGVEKGIGHLIEQGKDRQYTDSKGRLVVKRGNRTDRKSVV